MKRIKFIVNPLAGTRNHFDQLDTILLALLKEGHEIQVFQTEAAEDAYGEARRTSRLDTDLIVCSGGDGTVNEVVHGIMDGGEEIPLAIFPAGTVNDFATFLKMPARGLRFARMINDFRFKEVDIGRINDRFFTNVVAIGNIANVGHETDKGAKSVFGRLAYLFQGVKEVPDTLSNPFQLVIEADGEVLEEEVVLCLVSNSRHVGGFTNFSPEAQIDDGRFELLLIKAGSLPDLANVFIKIIQGEHIYDRQVIYRQVKKLRISSPQKMAVDIDGELYGYLPVEIEALEKQIEIMIEKE